MTMTLVGRLVVGGLALGVLWVAPMWVLATYGAIVGMVQIAKYTAKGE